VNTEIVSAAPAAAASALTEEETIRGKCPCCGGIVRSRLLYTQGHGYWVEWICDNASPVAPDDPVCEWRKVL
jgi:hypothetical protein